MSVSIFAVISIQLDWSKKLCEIKKNPSQQTSEQKVINF